jgi:hypothetical protein
VLPFVVCNGLHALPHPTSVRASVVRFDLSPVLTLCLFDGSSEGIAGFLISSLKAAALAFSSVRMLPVIHGFCLGYVRTVIVGTMSSIDLLMKPMTNVVYYSMPLLKSWNIFQSVLAKQSGSLAFASSDHFFIDLVTGARIRRIESWSDFPNGGRGRALYASLCVE